MFVTDEPQLRGYVNEANSELLLESVVESIKNAKPFDMCDASNNYLAKEFKKFIEMTQIKVKLYYPRWKWSKAIGYFSASNPNVINVNGYKIFNMSFEQVVSLFFHEAGHAMDSKDDGYSYHHGDNSPIGKENTFQYSLNRFVYEYYGYNREGAGTSPQTNKKGIVSFWRRIVSFIKNLL